ncbi:hypothetical protein PMAYCL1PPCAC_24658, partial [Pristionchus mayeri]
EATAGTKRDGKTEGGKTEGDATNEVTAPSNKQPKGPQVDQIVMIFPAPAPAPTPNNWQQADKKVSEKSAKDKG